MINQPTNELITNRVIPHGQERLATQIERDDVNRTIETLTRMAPQTAVKGITRTPQPLREAGDQVNRFLLCALVNESSKLIKETARKSGNSLPMSIIVRGVLKCYRAAAMDRSGPLAGPIVDPAGLQQLNARVLKDETERFAAERVRNGRVRLAHAERLGDDARIRIEKTELELAIESRNRLAAV